MKLHYREYGTYTGERPTLILLHGLLGSSANWHGISRRLASEHHLIVPDLRNHGRSPHGDGVGYPTMADDLLELMDEHGLESTLLVGHSMGGKVAMWLALEQPERVGRLVVVDIAPVPYPDRFSVIYNALNAIDLPTLEGRGEAETTLAHTLPDSGLRQYLLQNLTLKNGKWQWRINLKALHTGMADIVDFPLLSPQRQYLGETLFIYGSKSDYIKPEYQKPIHQLFPYARLRNIPGAGHWLFSEKPDEFYAALISFLNR